MATQQMPPILRGDFSTRSAEAARDYLRQLYADYVPMFAQPGDGFAVTVAYAQDGGYGVDRVCYLGSLRARTESSQQLLVLCLRRGWLRVADAATELRAEGGQALLLPPASGYEVTGADLDADVVRIESGQLSAGCEELTGARDPSLRLSAPLDGERAGQLAATIGYVSGGVLNHPSAAAEPLLRAQAFRLLLAAILHAFPNRALRNDPEPPQLAEPAVVRRAIDYIEAHAGESVGLPQIARAAGVGTRSLQAAFRRYRDVTPFEYLRRTRLENAHNDLVAADPRRGDTVARIATRWGFVNHGAFAAQYRKRYGCPPGVTLRG